MPVNSTFLLFLSVLFFLHYFLPRSSFWQHDSPWHLPLLSPRSPIRSSAAWLITPARASGKDGGRPGRRSRREGKERSTGRRNCEAGKNGWEGEKERERGRIGEWRGWVEGEGESDGGRERVSGEAEERGKEDKRMVRREERNGIG